MVQTSVAKEWDCMVSLLKKPETNQSSFHLTNGVTAVLPFLVSDMHRSGVLRVLSCLIIEDGSFHPDKERVFNAGAVRVLIRSLLLFTPKMQLEVLSLIELIPNT
ncbi:hypothetical protein CerSpe_293620 [Prunus speciosa]